MKKTTNSVSTMENDGVYVRNKNKHWEIYSWQLHFWPDRSNQFFWSSSMDKNSIESLIEN